MTYKAIENGEVAELADDLSKLAFPMQFKDDARVIFGYGLTKRQHYAALALPAIIAKHGPLYEREGDNHIVAKEYEYAIARGAWAYADALIATETEGQK